VGIASDFVLIVVAGLLGGLFARALRFALARRLRSRRSLVGCIP